MSYSISAVLSDLSGVAHGTTVNKVPNIYGLLNRTAGAVLLDIDPKETTRIVSLSQVFNNVFDYAVPVDLKGDRIIDIRPQAGRMPGDVFTQGYAQEFDSMKSLLSKNAIQTQWNTGVKTIRIEAPTLTSPTTITDTSTTTGWAATTGASTITLDTTNNVAGGGALTFNLSAGSATGYIENTTLTALDLSAQVNIATLFLWVYLPSASSMTSVNLRWGSDTTANYYSYTATTTQQGTAFQTGWNLIAFPWASASQTGTPVTTTIKAVRVTFTYNSTLQTGVKVCSLTSAPGSIMEIEYYSKYLFRDPSTGAFQERLTDNTDNNKLLNLDTESYNIFFNKAAFFVAQTLQGADAGYDADFFDKEYQKALKRYSGQNPSEAMLKGGAYYSMPKKGFGRFFSNQWKR